MTNRRKHCQQFIPKALFIYEAKVSLQCGASCFLLKRFIYQPEDWTDLSCVCAVSFFFFFLFFSKYNKLLNTKSIFFSISDCKSGVLFSPTSGCRETHADGFIFTVDTGAQPDC